MKKSSRLIAAILAAGMLASFAGCQNGSSDQTATTEKVTIPVTTSAETTAPSTSAEELVKTIDLKALTPIYEDGDDFAGSWKITDGAGSQYQSFVYQFDGKNVARLIIGTMGYLQKYQLKPESKSFTTQLMFGINGEYTYEISGDKKTITLKNTKSGETTTLTKQENYSCVPSAEKGDIDEKLLGAWQDGDGGYLYFDRSGVMYELQKGMSFTFYNYSAGDGVINGVYNMDGEQKISYKYSVDDATLNYNDYKYTRCSAADIKEME